jgi:hypothetical protein
MRALAIVLVVGLSACSRIDAMNDELARQEQVNSVIPKNYKSEILSLMRTYLNDPTQVRDAFISEPAMKEIDGANRYSVCVRYNAKKSGGQYAGSKDNLITFRQGRLDRVFDAARDPREAREIREQCKDAALKPFGELERLTR